MTYPIVKVKDKNGKEFEAYEAQVGDITLQIDKAIVDLGLTSMEDEIAAAQKAMAGK